MSKYCSVNPVFRGLVCVIAIWLGACSQSVFAERHALLVGIGDYPQAALDLLGPEHDLNALDRIIKENWQFKPENVRILRDQDATKSRVLEELRALKTRSKPGDQLFFYFSGHGTSASDESVRLPLPDMTAGLLPYDAKLNLAKHEIVASLIVGRTDLRPIFRDIDQSGRQMLVIIDACYSGNAVRGFGLPGEKMPSRFVRLDKKVDSLLLDSDGIQTRSVAAAASEEAYPYDNIFFISASGEYEEAADISGPYLKKFPTIDGKPHGAFSDAMLRALAGATENVDANGDQLVSHLETKQAIQNWMAGKFPQTPQHLPPAEEDKLNLASRSIFGVEEIPGTILRAKPQPQTQPSGAGDQGAASVAETMNSGQQQTHANTAQPGVAQPGAAEEFGIALDPALNGLLPALQTIAGIKLSDVYPDLRISATSSGTELRNGANDLIISYAAGFEEELIARVDQEVQIKGFINRLKRDRSFDISLDVQGKQNNGPHIGGEYVSFTVQTGKNAWLMLIDIDREGGINILFPSYRHERRIQPRSLVLTTPEIEVVAPYGTDRIIALGFSEEPVALLEWLGEETPRISPRTSRLVEFYNLVNKYSVGSAIQELPFITVAGN